MTNEIDKREDQADGDFENSLTAFHQESSSIPLEQGQQLASLGLVISDELRRSRRRFFFIFIVASILGYALSLSVCSQNKVALTAFSLDTAALLHQLPDPWCPLVCGWVFTSIPVLCLFLLLDRFQRRRLVSEFWWLPPLSTLCFCFMMLSLPASFQHEGMHAAHNRGLRATEGDLIWLTWWMLAAVSIPFIIAIIARRQIRVAVPLN